MFEYDGITTLVTGASKGIGEALAVELARRGSHLVLVARSEKALEELAARLRSEHGVRVEVLSADLLATDAAERVEADLEARGLQVDLLVNNAGMGAVGPFLSRPFEPNVRSIQLNVVALMALTHRLGTAMLARGRGGILNVASVAAFQPMPFQASYAASKSFVLSFTEALAEELRGTDVRVMAAHPGATDTGFFDASSAEMHAGAATPEKVAARTLDDFARGRSISFPGNRSDRALAFVSRLLPRARTARIAGDFNRRAGFDQVSDAKAIPASTG